MSERGIRPALQPKIEITTFDEGKDLEYTMAVEVLPEIVPADFSKIELERLNAEIGDDAVEDALKKIAAQQQSFEQPKQARAAKLGAHGLIDFEGALDGVKRTALHRRNGAWARRRKVRESPGERRRK